MIIDYLILFVSGKQNCKLIKECFTYEIKNYVGQHRNRLKIHMERERFIGLEIVSVSRV